MAGTRRSTALTACLALLLFAPEAHVSGRTRNIPFDDVVARANIVVEVKLPARMAQQTHRFQLPKGALQPHFDFAHRAVTYDVVKVLKGKLVDDKGEQRKQVTALSTSDQRSFKYERKVATDGARRMMYYDRCPDFDVDVEGATALLLLKDHQTVPGVYDAVMADGVLPMSRLHDVIAPKQHTSSTKPPPPPKPAPKNSSRQRR